MENKSRQLADTKTKSIINGLVNTFLCQNKSLITTAYRNRASLSQFHYSIVLKEDNMDNRNKIFDFFDKYDSLAISGQYPVYFQFVPIKLAEKINYSEELKLD